MNKLKNKQRRINLDIIYNNLEISKFINIIMISGKKLKARKILYLSFNYIKKKLKKNPIKVFFIALDNIAPLIEIKKKKIFGNNYSAPCEINKKRRSILAMKWLKEFSNLRKEKKFFIKLGNEIIDAYNKRGLCIKRRADMHKSAILNKSY